MGFNKTYLISGDSGGFIDGSRVNHSALPTPANLFPGQIWETQEDEGGFLGTNLYPKYPKGLYSPNVALNVWVIFPIKVQVSEDSVTLINIDDWAEFVGFNINTNSFDRIIYKDVTYKNLTGAYNATPPDQDVVNWDYAFPQGVIFVAKAGGDFKTIKAACDSITTSSITNAFCINVAAGLGNYIEDPFHVPDYVKLDLGGAIVSPNNLTSDFISLGKNATIQNGSIYNLGNTGAAIYADGSTGCTVTQIDIEGSSLVNGTAFYSLNAAQLTIIACSARELLHGFWMNNGAIVVVGVSSTNIGVGIRLTGFGFMTGASYGSFGGVVIDIQQDDATAGMRVLSMIVSVDKIIAVDFSTLKLTITSDKEDDESFLITQELGVGLPELGQESALGEGDSYTRGMLVYTETELGVFVDKTSVAASASGSTFAFPGLIADNAIYVCSSLQNLTDFLQPTGIKTKLTVAAVVGAGEIIPEYWNGSIWVEVGGFEAESSGQYLPHANNFMEHIGSHHVRFSNEFSDGLWMKNDPMGLGTAYYWGRFRIASTITTSPVIQQIKLHTNRSEINGDGWIEYYGKARPIGQLGLNLALGRPFEGNMQSQTIYINENIGVGYTANKFTATGDILGVSGFLPFDLDTSCPIKLIWSGLAANTAAIQWTVRWGWVKDGDTYYTAEPAFSPGSKSLVLDDNTIAGEVKRFKASLDVKEMISRREVGEGDEIWISIQPTILSGTFSLTTSQATYTKWCEGGHI